ncbi:MAG TPA: response regulator [Candidatus Kapabacteria bacterium]|nr:response regulator [Candidatus Kapabacteria bacterium]
MLPKDLHRDSLLTSHQAGELMQVNPSSVNKWVEEGKIRAFRTPGGHRRIRVRDLIEFLDEYKMPIPPQFKGMGRQRLLVVDNDPKQLGIVSRILKPFNEILLVEAVQNCIDGFVKVGAFKPHLIILDVSMPNLDSVEVCRRLKENSLAQSVDILIASTTLDDTLKKKARAAGARGCLSKPYSLESIGQELGLPITSLDS